MSKIEEEEEECDTIEDSESFNKSTKTPLFTLNNKFKVTKATNSSIQNDTFEDKLPEINNYRNIMSITGGNFKPRPTLFELQNALNKNELFENIKINEVNKKNENIDKTTNKSYTKLLKTNNTNNIVKFGWIQGVLIRCILNIFGVMLFLRLSWVVGQSGLGLTTLIIFISTLVTIITALSASAICTNGEVKGGGAYYLISRSLGPEFGGAIGIVFSFANAIAAAMYIVGFSETITELLKKHQIKIVDGDINDIRIIGLITSIPLIIIALIGMAWETKIQIGLLITLIISFVNFIVGVFIPPNEEKKAQGFLGFKAHLFIDNFLPDFREGEDFAHVFGVFFPAVTGILAGANISGNLKNPQKAIPKGTLLSIAISSTIYLIFAWIFGLTVTREATGKIEDLKNGTLTNCVNKNCTYGLLKHYQIMEMVSACGPIITAGIFSASLSSALASMISAPKIFQAVCSDRIFPKIEFFAVGYGKNKEPLRAYLLTYFVAFCCIAIGQLNYIAPIISNFFLMSYALINYSCFDASIAKTPGWRPSFKYYNKWISLFGALLCVSVMFIIKWWAALLTFVVIAGLYLYVKILFKPDVNWGSSTQAHIYRRSLEYSLKLLSSEEHVKNFRPQCLVLSGLPFYRPVLCDLAASITKNTSLMVCGNVVLNKDTIDNSISVLEQYNWLRKRRIKSFYVEINASNLREGSLALMQSSGIGKLKPNTLVIGFKCDWKEITMQSLSEYFQIINDAFSLKYGICIVRICSGLDYSDLLESGCLNLNAEDNYSSESGESDNDNVYFEMQKINTDEGATPLNNLSSNSKTDIYYNNVNNDDNIKIEMQISDINKISNIDNDVVEFGIKQNSSFISNKISNKDYNMFHRKIKKGFFDVWWLYDDGGLTLLIPYLISQRKHWQQCKLRIFIQTKNNDAVSEQRNMAALLAKFRIKFDDIVVITTFNKEPDDSNVKLYEKSIEKWRVANNEKNDGSSSTSSLLMISDYMMEQNRDKINHYIRLRELLVEHSLKSTIIVVTITVPSKLATSAALYLSWLDFISNEMPPMLMIRGNQASVITFYN